MAELERQRCGSVETARQAAAAANLQQHVRLPQQHQHQHPGYLHGRPVFLQQFDAAAGTIYYRPAPPGPVLYVRGVVPPTFRAHGEGSSMAPAGTSEPREMQLFPTGRGDESESESSELRAAPPSAADEEPLDLEIKL